MVYHKSPQNATVFSRKCWCFLKRMFVESYYVRSSTVTPISYNNFCSIQKLFFEKFLLIALVLLDWIIRSQYFFCSFGMLQDSWNCPSNVFHVLVLFETRSLFHSINKEQWRKEGQSFFSFIICGQPRVIKCSPTYFFKACDLSLVLLACDFPCYMLSWFPVI